MRTRGQLAIVLGAVAFACLFGQAFVRDFIQDLPDATLPWIANIFLGIIGIALVFALLNAVVWLLRFFFGEEVISLKPQGLRLGRSLFGLGETREYNWQDIKALGPSHSLGDFNNPFTQGYGWLKFDYGMETVYLARDVHEAEAKHILAEMRDFIKPYHELED